MFQLPTDPLPPTAVNPQVFVGYGPAKVGKDTGAALWGAHIHIDTEPGGGTAYLTCRRAVCSNLATLCGDPFAGETESTREDRDRVKAESRRESVLWAAKQAYRAHKESGNPEPYRVVLSSIGPVEEWCEQWATQLYRRTVQGKNFDMPSVYFLDRGLGYHLTRERMDIVWNDLITSCDELMILAHHRESTADKTESFISATDLDLVGKMRNLVARRCSVLGFFQRKDGALYVTFDAKKSEEPIVGTRISRLAGKTFPVAWVSKDGYFVHGWEHIYLPAGRAPKWVKSGLRKDQQPAPEIPESDGAPTTT